MENKREQRKEEIVKFRTAAINSEVKGKINDAFQDVVNRIKNKHL